ncbi:response regulator transcription factor [Pseudomonas sp. BRG-100]|uniref:response regulator transcription factor n=1 Tax=Pseudomonas sp. BRG-100 TaxID=1524267 RepID=UPI0009DCDBC4|nr:response regulator transcription factor [Pseudomonas sp. BRG-100]
MKIAIFNEDVDELQELSDILKILLPHKDSNRFCKTFSSNNIFMKQLRRDTFDLVMLDWQNSGIKGLQLLLWIQEHIMPAPPVIVLTGCKCGHDVVAALNAGAIDCMEKPFRKAELLARCHNAMRNSKRQHLSTTSQLVFANIILHPSALIGSVSGRAVSLTNRELNLALILLSNQGRPLSRQYLYDHLWSRDEKFTSRTLDTHIYRIRSKLQLITEFGWKLNTIYGYGYCLEHTGTPCDIHPPKMLTDDSELNSIQS